MALSGRAPATSDHLMNYTNTNQLIILFTSLNFLSVFVFDIIDMLSQWNNRAVSREIGSEASHARLLNSQKTRSRPIKETFNVWVDTKNYFNITRHTLICYFPLCKLINTLIKKKSFNRQTSVTHLPLETLIWFVFWRKRKINNKVFLFVKTHVI